MKNFKRYLIVFIFVSVCNFINKLMPNEFNYLDWRFVFLMTMGSMGAYLNLHLSED